MPVGPSGLPTGPVPPGYPDDYANLDPVNGNNIIITDESSVTVSGISDGVGASIVTYLVPYEESAGEPDSGSTLVSVSNTVTVTDLGSTDANGNEIGTYSATLPTAGLAPGVYVAESYLEFPDGSNTVYEDGGAGSKQIVSVEAANTQTTPIELSGTNAEITTDGRYLVYTAINEYNEPEITDDVYERDLQTGAETDLTATGQSPTGVFAVNHTPTYAASSTGDYLAYPTFTSANGAETFSTINDFDLNPDGGGYNPLPVVTNEAGVKSVIGGIGVQKYDVGAATAVSDDGNVVLSVETNSVLYHATGSSFSENPDPQIYITYLGAATTGPDVFSDISQATSGPLAFEYLWSNAANWSAGIPASGASATLSGYGIDDVATLSLASLDTGEEGADITGSLLTVDTVTIGNDAAFEADSEKTGGAVTVIIGTIAGGNAFFEANGANASLEITDTVTQAEHYWATDGGAVILNSLAPGSDFEFRDGIGTLALVAPGATISGSIDEIASGDVLELPGTAISHIDFGDTLDSVTTLSVTTSSGIYVFTEAGDQGVSSYQAAPDSSTGLVAITFGTAPTGPDVFSDSIAASSGQFLWSNAANWSDGLPGNAADVSLSGSGIDDLAALSLSTLISNGEVTSVDGAALDVSTLVGDSASGLVANSAIAGGSATVSVLLGSISGSGGLFVADGANSSIEILDPGLPDEIYQAESGGRIVLDSLSSGSKFGFVGASTLALVLPGSVTSGLIDAINAGDVLELPGSTVDSVIFGTHSLDIVTNTGTYDFTNVTFGSGSLEYSTSVDSATGLEAITFTPTPQDVFQTKDLFAGGAAPPPFIGDYFWSDAGNWVSGSVPQNGDDVTANAFDEVDDINLSLSTLNLGAGAEVLVVGNLSLGALAGAGFLTAQGNYNYTEGVFPATITVDSLIAGQYEPFAGADGAGGVAIINATLDSQSFLWADGGGFLELTTAPDAGQLSYIDPIYGDYFGGAGTIALTHPGATIGAVLRDVRPGDVLELPGTAVSSLHFGTASLTIATNSGDYVFSDFETLQPVDGYTAAIDPATGLVAITFTGPTNSGVDVFSSNYLQGAPELEGELWTTDSNWSNLIPRDGAAVELEYDTGTVSVDNIDNLSLSSMVVDSSIQLLVAATLNVGTLNIAAGGDVDTQSPFTVEGNVVNDGTISTDPTDILFEGAMSGNGTIYISAGSDIIFDGSVAAGQTIDFLSNGGTLTLNDAADFYGNIVGAGDIIANGPIPDVFSENVSASSALGDYRWSNPANWSNGVPVVGGSVVMNSPGMDDIAGLDLSSLMIAATTSTLTGFFDQLTVKDALTIGSLVLGNGGAIFAQADLTIGSISESSTLNVTDIVADGAGVVVTDNSAADPFIEYIVQDGATLRLAGSPNAAVELNFNTSVGTIAFSHPGATITADMLNLVAGDVLELPGATVKNVVFGSDQSITITTDKGSFDFSLVEYDPGVPPVTGYSAGFDATTGLEAITFTGTSIGISVDDTGPAADIEKISFLAATPDAIVNKGFLDGGLTIANNGTLTGTGAGLLNTGTIAKVWDVASNSLISGGSVGIENTGTVTKGWDVQENIALSGGSDGILNAATIIGGWDIASNSLISGGSTDNAGDGILNAGNVTGLFDINNAGVITGSSFGILNSGSVTDGWDIQTNQALEGGIDAVSNTGTVTKGWDVQSNQVLDGGTDGIYNSGTVIDGWDIQKNIALVATNRADAFSDASNVETITGGSFGVLNTGIVTGGWDIAGIDLISGGTDGISNTGSVSGGWTISDVGQITGGIDGISNIGNIGGGFTIDNDGTITGTAGDGILSTPADITNESDGIISGLSGIVLSAGGSVLNAGTIIGTGGTAISILHGPALVEIDPGAVFKGNVVDAADTGTLDLDASTTAGLLSGIGSSFTGFSDIQVSTGAIWTLNGVNTIAAGQTLADYGTLTVAGIFTNDGIVTTDPSTITYNSAVIGNGTIEIGADSDVIFKDSVAAGETVQFLSNTGTLTIDDTTGFAGKIVGSGVTIVNGVTVTASAGASPSLSTDGGTLTAGPAPDEFMLNLGSVTQGGAALSTVLDLANAASAPADPLGSSFSITGTSFDDTGFTNLTGIAAGATVIAGSISLQTGVVGTFSETIVLSPVETESNGTTIALPNETVDVTGVITPPTGSTQGDVHMLTFDGLHYNFQATGDFVLARSTTPGNSFQIQMRAAEYQTNPGTSVATEVAAKVGHDQVSFNIDGTALVSVNGIADTQIASPGAWQQLDGGQLEALSPTRYQLSWDTGETLTVSNSGAFLDTSVQLSPRDGPGSVQGLLGDDSGQANDFQLPDGTVLAQPVASATLLGAFADAWRVVPAASLLDTGSQDEPLQIGASNVRPAFGAMPFLNASSANANDQITAAGSNEILTGSAAVVGGLLNQTALPGITFHGTLAALGSDIITNFGSKDFIDITDLKGGSATTLNIGSATGILHLAYGGLSADLSIRGYVPDGTFQAAPDGHGGTLIRELAA